MKTKRIKTKKEKLLLVLDIAVAALCIIRCIPFYNFFSEGFHAFKAIGGSKLISILLFFYLIWLFILYIIVKNFIILAIYLAYRIPRKRILKHNTKYEVIENIEYFRERFDGITPSEISLLTDLEIETKKDLAASILNLYNKKLISFNNKKEIVINKDASIDNLKESDKLLYSYLLNNNLNVLSIKEWKKVSTNEAISDGYIVEKRKKHGFFSGAILTIFKWVGVLFLSAIIGGCYLVTPVGQKLMDNMDKYEVITKDIEDQQVIIDMIKNDKEFKQLTYDMYVESIPVAIVGTFAVVALFALFSMPFYLRARAITYYFVDANDKYDRTSEGKVLVEQIVGMKNFIHDFSNLSQSEKEEVVLWNDFIIYAILLEENEKIINEILKVKKMDVNILDNVNKQVVDLSK
ncbi:MAG: DUF2207 domain-containing protein [Bacilli bacterium]|nr:DUF2207 domain-containing protein [Bacilli bacterium]